MHETAELKVFAANWKDLIKYGPDDYFWNDEFYLKLDKNNQVIMWNENNTLSDNAETSNDEKDFFDDDYTLRSRLDDLIDEERTDLTSEIIQGLEQLTECKEEWYKIWALNKLSDIYLKGFGPIPSVTSKALEYNQKAIDLNSHKAYSNRAACFFFGLGLTKDLNKALEYAMKANELSKSNYFADILATKEDGGMYDKLLDMINNEIAKQKD